MGGGSHTPEYPMGMARAQRDDYRITRRIFPTGLINESWNSDLCLDFSGITPEIFYRCDSSHMVIGYRKKSKDPERPTPVFELSV